MAGTGLGIGVGGSVVTGIEIAAAIFSSVTRSIVLSCYVLSSAQLVLSTTA